MCCMLNRLRESEQGSWQTSLCVRDRTMQSDGSSPLLKSQVIALKVMKFQVNPGNTKGFLNMHPIEQQLV